MNEHTWPTVGELVKRRRERLGLRQDELRALGGPGSATVGKIERAKQDGFPPRTQHQMERALGWPTGRIEELMFALAAGDDVEDWVSLTVGADIPDLSKLPEVPQVDELETRLRALELRVARLELAASGTGLSVVPSTVADAVAADQDEDPDLAARESEEPDIP